MLFPRIPELFLNWHDESLIYINIRKYIILNLFAVKEECGKYIRSVQSLRAVLNKTEYVRGITGQLRE